MSPWTLRRTVARVVLLGPDRSVLLLAGTDPARRHEPGWWELPGGGVESWETTADAATRELHEETGIVAGQIEVGPCVWRNHARFVFGGIRFDQMEHIHVAWTDTHHEVRPVALEALEAAAFGGHRWWEVEALLRADDRTLPHRLREFLPELVDGPLPAEPHDITHHESHET